MSSQVDPEKYAALVVAKFLEMKYANSCAVAATILLYYDFLITFSDEVRCIWKRKFTGASLIFFINRYVTLVYKTFMIIQMLPWDHVNPDRADHICVGILRTCEIFTLTLQLVTAAFTSLRMYAIWSKDIKIFSLVLFLGLIPIGVNIYYYTRLTIIATPPPFTGCGELVDLGSPTGPLTLSIVNRVFAIVFDALILILTWIRTADIRKLFMQLNIKTSLAMMLLRDGTMYFVVLLILNVINLIAIKYKAFGSLPSITETITSIFVSRFIINLRSIYLSDSRISTIGPANGLHASTFHASKISDIRFAGASNLVGNLGAPLDIGSFDSPPELNRSSTLYSPRSESRRSGGSVYGELEVDADADRPGLSEDPLLAGMMDAVEREEERREREEVGRVYEDSVYAGSERSSTYSV